MRSGMPSMSSPLFPSQVVPIAVSQKKSSSSFISNSLPTSAAHPTSINSQVLPISNNLSSLPRYQNRNTLGSVSYNNDYNNNISQFYEYNYGYNTGPSSGQHEELLPLGVFRSHNDFMAEIKVNGRQVCLGTYATATLASR